MEEWANEALTALCGCMLALYKSVESLAKKNEGTEQLTRNPYYKQVKVGFVAALAF